METLSFFPNSQNEKLFQFTFDTYCLAKEETYKLIYSAFFFTPLFISDNVDVLKYLLSFEP